MSDSEKETLILPKKSSFGKKIITLIIFLLISFIWLWYQHKPSPTEKYDNLDNVSYTKFKTETTIELINAVDQNLDAFLEELSSMESFFYTVSDFFHITSNKREQLLEELWQTHFNSEMEQIVTSRVSILVQDMFDHNAECMADLQRVGVNVQGFERRIRDNLVQSIATDGMQISRSGANDAAVNFGIANVLGGLAGWSVTVLKSTWYTYLIGFVVDLAVSEIIDNKLSADLKIKVRKEILIAIDNALNSKDGLYAQIKAGIDKFHAERVEEIEKAEGTL